MRIKIVLLCFRFKRFWYFTIGIFFESRHRAKGSDTIKNTEKGTKLIWSTLSWYVQCNGRCWCRGESLLKRRRWRGTQHVRRPLDTFERSLSGMEDGLLRSWRIYLSMICHSLEVRTNHGEKTFGGLIKNREWVSTMEHVNFMKATSFASLFSRWLETRRTKHIRRSVSSFGPLKLTSIPGFRAWNSKSTY